MTILVNVQLGFDIVCVQCKTKMTVRAPHDPIHKCPKCGFQVIIAPAQAPAPGQPQIQPPNIAAKNMPKFKQPTPLA